MANNHATNANNVGIHTGSFDIGSNLPVPEKGKGRPLTDMRKSLRARAKATLRARRKREGLPTVSDIKKRLGK